jgi:methionyl-tRNA formyltransferase
MKAYIYERGQKQITRLCEWALINAGVEISETKSDCDIGVAPWLDSLIPPDELAMFKIGVLIFHPSLLPIYRGKSAIKDAFKNGDTYTGVTWFWAAKGYDVGDICEQAAIKIAHGSPREFYELAAIPVGVELLRLAVADLARGAVRRRPQVYKTENANFIPEINENSTINA